MKKISILYIPVIGEIKLMEISDDLGLKNQLVKGYIEYTKFTKNDSMYMVINEGAALKKEQVNIRATCVANNWQKIESSYMPTVTIYGDVFIEGSQLDVETKNFQSCSVPPVGLEYLIDLCNRAEVWWGVVSKNVYNSAIYKWFLSISEKFQFDDL